jgi:hypothetical protein
VPLRLTAAMLMLDSETEMEAEQTIAEIERIEHIFALPDARALSPNDSRLRIGDTTKCSLTARGFAFGSGMASVADLRLQCSNWARGRTNPHSKGR